MKLSETSAGSAILAVLLILSTLTNVVAQPTNAPPLRGALDTPAYARGEVLVKFSNKVTDEQIAQAFRGAGLHLVKQVQTAILRQKDDIGITRARTAMPVERAVALLRQLPGVEYAEPNWVYTHQATPGDPYFNNGNLWGMYGDDSTPANSYGSQAAEAWVAGYIGSRSVVVGVIDEGIQISHPDLAANIWVNPRDPLDGEDNDGNGFVDDVNGWDFFEDNSSVYDGTGDSHGTHVAGTIGAVGGNGLGVVGVNWAVSMISAKFLGPSGGDTADAVAAIDYFTDLKLRRGVPVVALNNSWGGGGYSQALHDAIIRAAKAGILFVAAAGNGNLAGRAVNNDTTSYYPACFNTASGTSTESAASYDAVIAVTAIDSSGNKARWANYGATMVDLGAPGVEVNSTLPDGYGPESGTSMATPHVTGAIALYASTHPDASAAEIKAAILDAGAPTASLSGKTVTGKRLDLSSVITAAPPAVKPVAPSNLAGTALSHMQIQLTWTDNSNNETRFEIIRNDGVGDTVLTLGANVTSYIDSNLKADTIYTYTIKACNSAGCSDASPSVSIKTDVGPPPASALYIGEDTATQGTWTNVYGTEGYHIYRFHDPGTYTAGLGVGISVSGAFPNTWADPDYNDRSLLKPDGSARFADCYYAADSFTLDVTLSEKKRVSVYCLDYDIRNRSQTIQIIDPNYPSVPLDTQSVAGFIAGKYLSWDLEGHVQIKVTHTGGDNAVLSGVFFDPVPDAPIVSISSPAPNATLSGMITITAEASDDVGVSKVEFFVNGSSIGTDGNSADGWSATWDTTSTEDGSYTLTAKATDGDLHVTTSAPVSVTVDNIPDPPTLHCGDLDTTKTTSGSFWSATVTVTVHDGHEAPVGGAVVTANWSGGFNRTGVEGITDPQGKVSFPTDLLSRKAPSVTFTISGITGDGPYQLEDNHDIDGGTDGTTVTILKP